MISCAKMELTETVESTCWCLVSGWPLGKCNPLISGTENNSPICSHQAVTQTTILTKNTRTQLQPMSPKWSPAPLRPLQVSGPGVLAPGQMGFGRATRCGYRGPQVRRWSTWVYHGITVDLMGDTLQITSDYWTCRKLAITAQATIVALPPWALKSEREEAESSAPLIWFGC